MSNTNPKIIFLDRDGVINKDPIGDYIKNWDNFEFHDGVLESVKKLTDSGYTIIIVSNQAGIGDGSYDKKDLDHITKKMIEAIKDNGGRIDDVFYCLHGKQEGCECRKPKPGLFKLISQKYKFNPSNTYYIGDKKTDILAGKSYGLKTILVLTGHGSIDVKTLDAASFPDHITNDLLSAVNLVLGEKIKL